MAGPEPWRKTGRKAKDDHWLGLADNVLVELAVYDDRSNQQGHMVAQLKVERRRAAAVKEISFERVSQTKGCSRAWSPLTA